MNVKRDIELKYNTQGSEILRFIEDNGSEAIEKLAQNPYHLNIEKIQESLYRIKIRPRVSRTSIQLVRESNNIIVDANNNKIVCGAYPFIYDNESSKAPDIKYSESKAREFIDGHTAKLYYYNGEWIKDIETDNKNLKEMINELLDNVSTQNLNPEYTYIFKYINPDFRIVTPYTETKIYLVETYSNSELKYLDIYKNNITVQFRDGTNIEKPKTYTRNTNTILYYADKIQSFNNDKDKAGLIIKDSSGRTIRMTTNYYKSLRHSLLQDDSIHTISILRAVSLGEQDWYLKHFPEDKQNVEIVTEHFKNVERKVEEVIKYCKQYKSLDKNALIEKAVSIYGKDEHNFSHLYALIHDMGYRKEIAYEAYALRYAKRCYQAYKFPELDKPIKGGTQENETITVDKTKYPLKIQEFIIKHKSNWDELLSDFPYFINITSLGTLTLFKYNQLKSDFSLDIVKEARGLILDNTTFKIVRIAFDKFFNYGESEADDIDWQSAEATEKIDGSLISLYYYDNKWRIATNGMIDAFSTRLTNEENDYQYATFGELAKEALNRTDLDINKLDKNNTYTFELVSPYNKVVVEYADIEIYHILTRNNITLEEVNEDIEVKKPMTYSFKNKDSKEFIKFVERMGEDKEGIVVKDKFNHRVKIKTQSWMDLHYKANNNVLSFSRIVDIILSGETEEAMVGFPNYKGVILKMLEQIDNINKRLAEIEIEIDTDKKNGLATKDVALKYKGHNDFTLYMNTLNGTISKFTSGLDKRRFIQLYKLKDLIPREEE